MRVVLTIYFTNIDTSNFTYSENKSHCYNAYVDSSINKFLLEKYCSLGTLQHYTTEGWLGGASGAAERTRSTSALEMRGRRSASAVRSLQAQAYITHGR